MTDRDMMLLLLKGERLTRIEWPNGAFVELGEAGDLLDETEALADPLERGVLGLVHVRVV